VIDGDGARPEPHLDRSGELVPGDAVGAILLLEDGRYLLQQRDDIPGIFFPGHWGCFGGGVDPGETAEQALARELAEETAIDVSRLPVRTFTRHDYDLSFAGCGRIYRIFFEVRVDRTALAGFKMGEGRAARAFAPDDVLRLAPVTPYDAFALWLHINQGRLRPAA
jgi:8-oxo-dGTP pyrophosphatase MutT (NUDIX family)